MDVYVLYVLSRPSLAEKSAKWPFFPISSRQKYDILSEQGIWDRLVEVPEYIESNLNPKFSLRKYQKEAMQRLIFYLKHDNGRD